MDKREAIDALAKLSYDRILVEDEYIVQDDGTPPVRNQMFSIAEAFKVKPFSLTPMNLRGHFRIIPMNVSPKKTTNGKNGLQIEYVHAGKKAIKA